MFSSLSPLPRTSPLPGVLFQGNATSPNPVPIAATSIQQLTAYLDAPSRRGIIRDPEAKIPPAVYQEPSFYNGQYRNVTTLPAIVILTRLNEQELTYTVEITGGNQSSSGRILKSGDEWVFYPGRLQGISAQQMVDILNHYVNSLPPAR